MTIQVAIANSIPMFRRALVLVSVVFLAGCMTVVSVRPEELESDLTKDILVIMRDGRTIKMEAGSYFVVRKGDRKVIRGKGEVFVNESRTESRRIEEDIPFEEVKSLETRERTIFYYSGPIVMGIVAFFLLIILLALGSGGMRT